MAAQKSKKSRALSDPNRCAREHEVAQGVKDRSNKRTRAPNLKMEQDSETNQLFVEFDHDDAETAHFLAMADMGTCDGRFLLL
jgi:threonine aldolase